MTTPAIPALARTAGPLDATRFTSSGPPGPGNALIAEHLRLLGSTAQPGGADRGTQARITLEGPYGTVGATTTWGEVAVDEATAQAVTGVMDVHGRRDGSPRGLGADYLGVATGILTVQGLLAALLGRARGLDGSSHVAVSAERAGLLTVSQYVAAAGADEGEAAELAPGGPPFTSREGTLFEIETLDAGVWSAFWTALGAPAEDIRRSWRPFQFRYATACAPLPPSLHEATRVHSWARIRSAAASSGADLCALQSLDRRAREYDGAPPWLIAAHPASYAQAPHADGKLPLSGLTVLEAGRRIQAPLAAHLLGLLGARVIRIEPPGGDPLRGMPPTCSGVSARWLALNRGKAAVEVDIKSPTDRARLKELVAEADVFLHNWAPGKAAQLGLDHVDLSAVRPSLVYAYTSGWAGRLHDAPMGTDFMVQARTGVGEAVRPVDEPAAPSLMTLLDVLGGLLGAEAVLAGLLLRERTGCGARVDSSLLSAADVLTAAARSRTMSGLDPRPPAGFRRPLRTLDGWVAPADFAAVPLDTTSMTTSEAVNALRQRGLAAAPVVTDLARPVPLGPLERDTHGAPRVPSPWSFT